MSESPEDVLARIRAEELAKGSDPRVAEARAKAAEARARHDLPIDPQEAWPIKLEREGGEASARPAAVVAAEPEPTAAAASAPPAPETTATEAPAEPAPAEAPAPATPAPATPAPATPMAGATAAVPIEPYREPEVGEAVGAEGVIAEIGGVKVADARLPAFVVALLLAITAWAMIYLITSSGAASSAVTGCERARDGTFTCFRPAEGTGAPSSEGSGAGH